MNIDLPSLAIPNGASLEDFIEAGRSIKRVVETVGFMLGDWANALKEQHPQQYDLALESVGVDRRSAQRSAHVAKAFPKALRNEQLSFDHHRAVLALPRPEQLDLLKQAGDKHWKPQELKEAVVQRRYETGADFTDEDVDSYLTSRMVKEWNRATVRARQDFAELMAVVSFGIIDEDVAYD